MIYTIDFHTGIRHTTEDMSLENVEIYADKEASYTQQKISIEDSAGDVVAERFWYGNLEGIEDDPDPIQFGTFGYYSAWVEY